MHLRRLQHSRRFGAAPEILRRKYGGRSGNAVQRSFGTRLQLEQLEPRLALAGVVINEFLASNTNGLTDVDGERSDWIELKNTDSTPVNIGGWYLADSTTSWQFPAITLAPDQHLLVFASGKNRAVAGQELHTNFQLDGDGESLKLLGTDGVTVVHAFDPFPAQLNNISYGLGAAGILTEPIVDETEPVRVHVPTSGVLGTTWTQNGFDDASWLAGDTAVGYERSPGSVPDYNSYFQLDVNTLMPAAQARDTIYLRIAFNVTNVNAFQGLDFLMRYDDGFVAYLNGQEIARRNAPASPSWNSAASGSHNDNLAIVYETIPATAHLNKLVEGANVLAIHGLNASSGTNRNDFLIGPMLVAQRRTEPVIGYMTTPTPGTANQQGTLGFVADTKFSKDRGFYDAPFNVEITTATADAQIRYTTDGSAPTATTGLVYNPASPPLVTTTTTLRAAAFKAGFTSSNVDTQTYVFLDRVLQQNSTGLPAASNWGHAGPDWAMDPDIVNSPLYGPTLKNDLQAVPTVSLVMPWTSLFGSGGIYISGQNIERPGSVELFTADGSQNFQIDAAVEIMGGTSVNRWNNDKLSIRVTFKEPFGPTKLNEPVFVDPFFDDGAAVEFDTLVLDAVYNHSWAYGGGSTPTAQRDTAKFIQDQYVADLQNFAGGKAPHGRFVHLYLNGLYWGMYYLHERPDDSFAESYLGGDKDEYDVLKHNATDVVAGDTTAAANYQAMLNAVRQNLTIPANYAAVQQVLDVDDFIDYMLVNYYVGNEDWAHQNWYATFKRHTATDTTGRWRFHSWDAEHVLESLGRDSTGLNNVNGPTEIQIRLMTSPEYRLRFSDRVQKHFNNEGVFTAQTAGAIYAARVQMIDRAIVGESARWGDNRREPPYTRADWLTTQNDLLNNYFPNRARAVLNQFGSRGWLVPVGAPVFSQYGGTIDPGFQLTLQMPPGAPSEAQIYYTLNGSDPRNASNSLPSTSAILYTGSPITLNAGAQVNARIFAGGTLGSDWSAVVETTFVLDTPFPVRITELHYNPAQRSGVADEQDMEFIELLNTGNQTVSLAGVQIAEFASTPYVFGSGISLDPGERIVVARSPAVIQQVYGPNVNVAPVGYSPANFSNGGERIVLLGPLGEKLQDFVYDDIAPWPTAADGDGPSLEIIDPLGDPSDPANWRASSALGGSPGVGSVTVVGDYDGNAAVNDNDRLVWRASFGQTVPPGTGADGNGDGNVDAADYVVWRKAFGSSGMAASAVAAAILEPPSVAVEVAENSAEFAVTIPPGVAERNASRSSPRSTFQRTNSGWLAEPSLLLAMDWDAAAVDELLSRDDSIKARRDDAELEVQEDFAPTEESPHEVSANIWEDEAWLGSLAVMPA